MALVDDITAEVREIFCSRWSERDGQTVPEPEDLKLGNDAVNLEATVLYADLAESTQMVKTRSHTLAAEGYKAYLKSACRVIRFNGGEITAFDGDRVMAVFLGGRKNTQAAKTALQINWVVSNIVNPELRSVYKHSDFVVKQAVGIDTGKLLVARTGIRGANDLVWVGQAANYAAKLCSLRDGAYVSWITQTVFNSLLDEAKYGGTSRELMWTQSWWKEFGIWVHGSSWTWNPSV